MVINSIKSYGYIGAALRQCYGSLLVDVFALMVAFSIAAMTGILPVLLLPVA